MINRMRMLGMAAASVLTVVSVVSAQTPPQTPQQQAEKAVKTRQGLFDVQAFAFGPVGAMLKGAPVDAPVAQKEAARIQMTAGMIPEVFQLDTRKFKVTTKARETIWGKKSDFDQKASDLQTAAANLEMAAKKGVSSGILEAAEKVGGACKACHDDFREK
jgi:cytochrome c556